MYVPTQKFAYFRIDSCIGGRTPKEYYDWVIWFSRGETFVSNTRILVTTLKKISYTLCFSVKIKKKKILRKKTTKCEMRYILVKVVGNIVSIFIVLCIVLLKNRMRQ